ncbi:MAG: 4-hydroxybenzoate octaprenyltransferase [Deltaproteobacteria bacterium]|nr:4-hydroxybenzoate octaprenyltransferase [Deltaproteobacteria bacterium]
MAQEILTAKLTAVSDLIRLPKQYGTAFVLLPTLWALFMASGGRPSPKHLFVFIAGAFLMRSAGCAINDIADRRFDRMVERTKARPIAGGRLSVAEAAMVFLTLSFLAFMLVLTLNRLTVLLSFAAIALASVYPFVKRVSYFPQVFLGMAFGWGAVMAWAAVTGSVGLPAMLIFVANVFWSTAYDTIYALMDMEDDVRAGVKSTAIFFGRRVWPALAVLYTMMAIALAFAGWAADIGIVYYEGLVVSYALFFAILNKVMHSPAREAIFRGFVANIGPGALILFSIIAGMGR